MPPSFAVEPPTSTRAVREPPTAGPSRAGRGLWRLALACLALAGLSLLVLPRGMAYDPWSWLIWGREILHLDLNTRQAATAVKPLPIALDTLFALTGSAAAPLLWLLVARAATLLSVGLAFRVARRLAGVGAGLVAATALVVADEYLGYLFMRGMSEPAATAAVLAAVDFHLDGRRKATVGALVAAGLLRPEAWPFLFVYCLWLAMSGPAWRRVAALALAVAVPASWFVIDWFGSGQLSRSANAAQHSSQGGPLLYRHPGIATVRETWHLMSGPVVVLFLVGTVWAVVASIRSRRVQPAAWLSLGAFSWLVIDAVLAQGRFATGAPRYLLPGVGLASVVVAIFVMDVVRRAQQVVPRRRAPAVFVIVLMLALGLVAAPRLSTTAHQVRSGIRIGRDFDGLQSALPRAVAKAGGRGAVARCGRITTQAFQVPLVAWELRQHVGYVGINVGVPGTVFQDGAGPALPPSLRAAFRSLGTVGSAGAQWTVWSTCAPPGSG